MMAPKNFRSYEQRRADDPMIVLEDETMEEQPKYNFQGTDAAGPSTRALQAGSLAQQINNPVTRLDLTADEQIRMKALECATTFLDAREHADMLWGCVEDFEDYLKNGR